MENFILTKDSTPQDFVEELREAIKNLGYRLSVVSYKNGNVIEIKSVESRWYLVIVLTSPKFQLIPSCDTQEYLEVALLLRKILDLWCEVKGIKG